MSENPITPGNNIFPDNQHKVKLLIAEDDHIAQMIVNKQLEPYPFYEITFCDDGDEFMVMLESIEPDLILMDIRLPNISGIELIRQIRVHEKFKDLPILVLSASAFKEDIDAGIKAGATEYITKPYNLEKFIDRLLYYTMKVAEPGQNPAH
ncbi:response regulator [Chitinophaga sp. 212800010-3]|uniref:response regulator n=1 Tax=unclassified Chitinophaga TaxID=2619133 RepID=UPI002DE7B469|nr:hypothetical protein [Chitinophaga sp. 212800010-3]